MIKLYEKIAGRYLGEINEADLQFLIDTLEEENLRDKDYYIDRATFEFLEERGMSPELGQLLAEGLLNSSNDEIEIRYEKS